MQDEIKLLVRKDKICCYRCGRRWRLELPMKIGRVVSTLHRIEREHRMKGRCRPKKNIRRTETCQE
jgi:hypothetical protein